MKKITLFFLIMLAFIDYSLGQATAKETSSNKYVKTSNGKIVVLYPNNTWEYLSKEDSIELVIKSAYENRIPFVEAVKAQQDIVNACKVRLEDLNRTNPSPQKDEQIRLTIQRLKTEENYLKEKENSLVEENQKIELLENNLRNK
jgi:hypothetical protein